MAIQIRRGNDAEWESNKSNIVAGEPAVAMDTERMFIGTGSGTFMEVANIEVLADAFDSSASYVVGDFVSYHGKVYKCNTDHSGAWNASHFDEVALADALDSLGDDVYTKAETDALLALKADESDVDSALALKADKTEVGTLSNLTTTNKTNLVSAINEVKGDIPSVPSPSNANPQMDGTASAGISADYSRADHVHPTDTSRASASDLDAITETVYGKNRFNINGNIIEGYLLGNDGSLIAYEGWNISDYCYVEGFTNVYCWSNVNGYAFTMWYACAYNSNKEFLSSLGNGSTFVLPEGTAYIRFCENSFNNQIMLESGTTKTSFEAYSEKREIITDATLTLANVPADAKAVGESIGIVKDQLSYSAVSFTLIDSKYLNGATGAITDASGTNNKVSDYIEIVPNSKIMITTEHFWGQGLYAFYDKDKNFISGKKSNSGGTVTQIYNEIVKAPINAKYLVIGFLYQASMPEPFVFQGITQQANPSAIWADKKWTVVGDSLTAYNTRTSMHYFDYIAGATGINIHNMGVSGSGYAKLNDNFMTRVLNVPTDSDVVTIFGSGNDASAGLDLGTASDTGTSTLGGVINTTIDNLYSIMPIVNLGIITPTPWQGNMPSDNGWMENYANLIVEICKRRSIPCLDLFHCSNLNPNSADVRAAAYSKDDGGGVHPDETGHKMIAPRIKGFLDTLVLP